MTITKRLNTLNTSNFISFDEPKIRKLYDDTPKENIANELKIPTDQISKELNQITNNAVSFDKVDSSGLNFEYPTQKEVDQMSNAPIDPVNPQQPVEKSNAEKRAEKRAEWKSAADVQKRAMQQLKEADEKLKKAKEVEILLEQAKKDPTAVAKALNMDPGDFLKQYQNHILNMPTETQLKPEEQIAARLQKYEEERAKEREQFAQFQSATIKQTYIANKILPVILADKDKFEIINNDDPKLTAAMIYDVMNEHYMKHGEELNPSDVAEEIENMLAKEIEERIAHVSKLNKFSKRFVAQAEQSQQLGETQVEQPKQSNQLGANTFDSKPSQGLPVRKQMETIQSIPAQSNVSSAPAPSFNGRWASKRDRKLQDFTKKMI